MDKEREAFENLYKGMKIDDIEHPVIRETAKAQLFAWKARATLDMSEELAEHLERYVRFYGDIGDAQDILNKYRERKI